MTERGLGWDIVSVAAPDAFGAIGLDETTSQVLEALAADSRCTGTVESVAECAAVPRARAARALSTLVELGLASRAVDSERFAASPVEAALGAMVAARRQELARAETAARALALRATRQQQRVDPEQVVSVITGSRQIRAVQEQLLRTAQHTVRTLDRPPYVTPPAYSSTSSVVDPLQPELLDRGIAFRTVYDAALLDDAGSLGRIRSELSSGEQGRVLADLPVKLMVADESLALLPLLDPVEHGEPAALLLRPSVLLDSLVTLFEALWRAAIPLVLTGDDGAAPAGEDPELRRLVELLAGGLTEERLARLLGISDRTVRRRLAAIRESLGVSTMFQAGVAAARQGWI
jgi:DNA-binding CsgD family transcriptional regulator